MDGRFDSILELDFQVGYTFVYMRSSARAWTSEEKILHKFTLDLFWAEDISANGGGGLNWV